MRELEAHPELVAEIGNGSLAEAIAAAGGARQLALHGAGRRGGFVRCVVNRTARKCC